jgi:predicted nucleic acid-binding protein
LNLRHFAYFDTSTWLKIYFLEKGSEQARVLATEYSLVSSVILLTECFSALSRKKKSGEIKAAAFKKIIETLREDAGALEMVQVTPRVLTMSQHIVLASTVRTLDAIHIASALLFEKTMGKPIVFISSDLRQTESAEGQGLKTILVS